MTGLLAFRWDAELGKLLAFGLATPGEVVIGFDSSVPADLLHWEGSPMDPPAVQRFGLDEFNRPALPVSTPSILQWRLHGLSAQTLDVAVAVLDVGLVLNTRGRLERGPGHGDGVTFAVELSVRGETTRIWERHVSPDVSWFEERVRLPDELEGPVVLRLITEPGPAGLWLHDHALWAGLHLRGETDWRDPRPNLVVIDLDTLRADRLGCYGAVRDTTPRIDAWAEASAQIFENATSVECWTLPSTISMLTGLAVSQHGVHRRDRRMTAAMEPVAMRLARVGYETHARTDSGYVIPAMGFAEGFDSFDYKPLQPGEDWADVLTLLEERNSPAPVFCFVQTYWPHEPYLADPHFADSTRPYDGPLAGQLLTLSNIDAAVRQGGATLTGADRRHVNEQYDAAVFRTDALVGDFLDGLERIFADEPYLVLLTSDHGQELFDRGSFGHGLGLHAEQLRVPLILRHVGATRVGRSEAPVTGLDLVPTLLDAAGLSLPSHLPGRSLLQRLPADAPQVAWHSEHDSMLQLSGFKLISAGDTLSLFDLAADPRELEDLSLEQPELVERMSTFLGSWIERWQPLEIGDDGSAILSAEDRAALNALGY
jgi:arylsulfatase A-like enzyme